MQLHSPDQNEIKQLLIQTLSLAAIVGENPNHASLSEKDVDALVAKKSEVIQKALDESEVAAEEAIIHFRNHDHSGNVTRVFDKIHSARSRENLAEISNILYGSEEFFNNLLRLANEAFQEDHVREARAMFSLIATLYPTHIKPYILLAMTEWKENGIAAAVHFYETLIKALPHPFLYLCAGDCFSQAGEKNKAINVLREALNLVLQQDNKTPADLEIQENIEKYLQVLER
jgi:tetratricopeptide (TPR) repeat protein